MSVQKSVAFLCIKSEKSERNFKNPIYNSNNNNNILRNIFNQGDE